MRYALPISDGVIAAHFGHCEQFALIDVDEQNKKVLRKEIATSPGHQPGLLPEWLAEQGVSVVIAGGMGSRAQDLFQQSRIQVVIGASGDNPEKVVLDHIQGKLTTGDNICDH